VILSTDGADESVGLAVRLSALGVPAVLVAHSRQRGWLRRSTGTLPGGEDVDGGTVQYAASVAKQFTAALAALAVAEGTLSSSTTLRSVLPQLPDWADCILLHHLVHHTAGLPATSVLTQALRCEEPDLDNELVIDALSRLRRLPQPPGRAFAYSNLGYVLLAEVVRAATGTALQELARTRLHEPLGLRSARWGGPPPITWPGLPVPPATTGDGGLWISATDLLRWLQALNGDALGAQVGRLLRSPGHLDDGTTLPYAWGITARPNRLGTVYTHGGNWPGWTAKTVRQPATGTAVALMTFGADPVTVSDLAVHIAEHLSTGSP